jgi:AcrR family transcriptional regulator
MSKNNKSARTKAEILDTAWRLIATEGADTSMSKLAAAVGLTRQSIYVHFGSRGGLLMALVNRADERENIWHHFQAALAAPTAKERLEAVLTAWFDFVPQIYPVARDLIRLKRNDKEASAAWYDRMDALYAFYLERVSDLAAEGTMRKGLSAEEATDLLWSFTSVQHWELLVHDRGWAPAHAATQMTNQVLNMITGEL